MSSLGFELQRQLTFVQGLSGISALLLVKVAVCSTEQQLIMFYCCLRRHVGETDLLKENKAKIGAQ